MATQTEMRSLLDDLTAGKLTKDQAFDTILAATMEAGFTMEQAQLAAGFASYAERLVILFQNMEKLHKGVGWQPLETPIMMGLSAFREAADLAARMDTAVFGIEQKAGEPQFFSVFRPGTLELANEMLTEMATLVQNSSTRRKNDTIVATLDKASSIGAQAALGMAGKLGEKPPKTETPLPQLFILNTPNIAADLAHAMNEFSSLALMTNSKSMLLASGDLLNSVLELDEDGHTVNTWLGQKQFFEFAARDSQIEGIKLIVGQMQKISRGETFTAEDEQAGIDAAANLIKARREATK